MNIHDCRLPSVRFFPILRAVATSALLVTGCATEASGPSAPAPATTSASVLAARIGAAGGELIGAQGTPFEGVHITVPAGALAADTDVRVTRLEAASPLPATAIACGPAFSIEPAGLALALPASVTLPVDDAVVTAHDREDDEVKVWTKEGDHWGQAKQSDGAPGSVTVALPTLTDVQAGVSPPKGEDVIRFDLAPNPKFVKCLAQYPDDASRPPRAHVTVVRGELNDTLTLRAEHLKPGLAFDVFTVERSPLAADATPDPAFSNFGLAWYQSDLEARGDGGARVSVRSIFLDQIFGFDPAATLPPTPTFHVGFWFNDPNDAAPCGFDASKPTPFNGDHHAGPLAMISVPDAATHLGPLCTKPDTSVTPARCSP